MARALVVIDVQQDYFAGGHLPLFQAEEAKARIVSALGAARQRGDRIILVRHLSTAATGLFAPGGAGVEIHPEVVAAAGNAPLITKRFADAFQETDLAARLEGVSEVLIAGMMTQNCVVFSAMSAAASRYAVMVVGDLCAAPSEIVHRVALNALASKLKVSTAADVWAAAPAH